MKLSKCTHGTIVTKRRDSLYGTPKIGMIIGITNNVPLAAFNERAKEGNAVMIVQWSSGETSPIHPHNIEPYRD